MRAHTERLDETALCAYLEIVNLNETARTEITTAMSAGWLEMTLTNENDTAGRSVAIVVTKIPGTGNAQGCQAALVPQATIAPTGQLRNQAREEQGSREKDIGRRQTEVKLTRKEHPIAIGIAGNGATADPMMLTKQKLHPQNVNPRLLKPLPI
jgi:hypothetical protein